MRVRHYFEMELIGMLALPQISLHLRIALLAALIIVVSPRLAGAARTELPPSSYEEVNRNFDDFLKQYRALKPDVDKLIKVQLTAKPALAKVGEKISVTIRAATDKEPNEVLEIYPRYLESKMGQKETFKLAWKKAGKPGGNILYQATLKYTPTATGNYVIHWKCDIGGDVPEFWRYFAVVDNSYAVCTLESTSHFKGSPDAVLHEFHLPFKYWQQVPLFREGWNAEMWAAFSRKSRQFGDRPAFMLWVSNGEYMKAAPGYEPKVSGWQVIFQNEKPEVQRLILERHKKDIWPTLGFDEPIANVQSYGFNKKSIELARELGYQSIGSMFPSHNFKDGTFPFNHAGMPDRPYFMAKEDFRKTGNGGKEGLVGIPQCHFHPPLNAEYNCMYVLEPIALIHPGIPGSIGRKVFDAVAFSQIQDFFEAMLQNRLSQRVPYIFNVGLEFYGLFPGTDEANDYFVRHAAAKAAEVPLVFASGDAVAEYYRRHYRETPETTAYLQDFFCGTQPNGKPPLYPDVMTIENARMHSTNRRLEILPYTQYDYTTSWKDYPDWGLEGIPRREIGYIYPDSDDRFRMTPRMIDTRRFKATREDRETAGATEIRMTVQSELTQKNLALAVWDIPREWRKGQRWFATSRSCRFVPVRAPYSGNLNGFLLADVKAGVNRFTLKVKSPRRELEQTELALNGGQGMGQIRGQVFTRDGRTMAYLCPAGETTQTLRLTVPAGRDVRGYVAPEGEEIRCKAGLNEFKLAPKLWMRLVGMTRAEIVAGVGGK